MTKQYISCTDTAKLMRSSLKAQFPGVKFSVKSSSYSGGASIRVSWTDGPYQDDVEKITKRYEGATFDGMIDLKEYRSDLVYFDGQTLPTEVHYGSDFVFTDRDLSDEYVQAIIYEGQQVLDRNQETSGQVFSLDGQYKAAILSSEYGTIYGPYISGWQITRHLSKYIPARNNQPTGVK
jgi:hypothetical protein